jgi:uncharacterized protein HemY
MIRFLIACLFFIFLYLIFIGLNRFDSPVTLDLYNYIIKTSFFTIVSVALICVFLLFIVLKVIFLVVALPSIIKDKIKQYKNRGEIDTLISAASFLIIDDKTKALKTIKRLELPRSEYKEFFALLLASLTEKYNDKVEYYRHLLPNKKFEFFALKQIALLYFNNDLKRQALDPALNAFNIKEDDPEIIEILMDCYTKEKSWDKLLFVISKLNEIKEDLAFKTSYYLLLAAKNILEQGDDTTALKYLEKSLTYHPNNLEAIDLYSSLMVTSGNTKDLLEILLNAFKTCPSFEIAEIYCKATSDSNEQILKALKAAANPQTHRGLFLAIEAYLASTSE